ncbi:MAG: hypothetical protein QOD00_3529, partial [Blastocatellia bacterium]|nr:hypothetical protein [Blastocatellia bacterium]
MSELSQRIAGLSPEKRRLLEAMLQEESSGSDSFPLSFAQQRLWFLDQLEPGSPIYNIPAAVRLNGSLKIAALESGFNEIIRRHEALRTTFSALDGEPIQLIAPALTLSLPVVDLSAFESSEREAEVQRLAREEARRPFDLARGPLVRATLLRLCEEEHVLLLTMHHIISDGWSAGILIKEMAVLYEAFAGGLARTLPPLSIQYADFVIWQRRWLQGEVLEQQLAYWKRQLGGHLPVLELPADYLRPAVETFQGRRLSFQLTLDQTAALKKLCLDEGATLFMTLLAAFQVLLHRYTSQPDIAVGTPVASRTRVETETLIGFFANTLVLRTDLSGNPTFLELLKRVRDVTLEGFDYQELPFEKLVEELHPERDMSRNPLFQVMFVLQNAPMPPLQLPGLSMQMFEVDSGTSKFDLTLLMQEEAGILGGSIEYNSDLFEAATITRMAGHFQTLLEGLAAHPATRLLSLPLLTPVEAERQLIVWNNTRADYSTDHCIHQVCEAQAAQRPSEVAVIFEGQTLTYDELNRKANRLAHYLRRLGVKPEVLVGICLERSLEMVLGLLAVIKAGGACVALDPKYPPDRLAFIIRDARMPVLLTQESLAASLPETGAVRICLDRGLTEFVDESEENPASGCTSENLLYAIYTSGSTGLPKGIGVPHRAFLNLLQWQ